jgi:predicted metal-dependent hydrolase
LVGRNLLDLLFRKPPAKRVRTRAELPPHLSVECNGTAVPVEVHVRDSARRMILRLDRRSGNPALTVPRHVGRVVAERFLSEHAGWLAARLKARPLRIDFAPGVIIPIGGVPHRIAHRPPFRGVTRVVEEDNENLLVVHGDPGQAGARVERFLRAEAARSLALAVTRHAGALGVSYGRITIKDTRSRWGSCSARGDLAFSWRLILAPPEVLDYLAAHEVAHRLEMNHSTRYWRHVARLFPNFRETETWLNCHGASLHLYGTP